MTTVAAKPARPAAEEERHQLTALEGVTATGSRPMTAEPGPWWLVLLGGLAGQATLVAAAEESLDRLARLAGGLLDVSRLQAGARAVFPRPADLGGIVAAALENLGPQPQPVLADIPCGLPEVMADPAIAERVIVNLAGNALRYSPATAPPLLTARTAGNGVELRVVDHGPGIPATDRKRVFQPFCQLGALGDSTGVGLGLAVARGLAETMGGTVEPEDTPCGVLTMVLTLPAAPARPAAEPCGTRRIRAA